MASHNPRATLEALPTEILQTILSQMSCTEDLSAAIHASPTMFQSFLGWREQILIRVIQSTLHAEIFMEILGLVDVPNFGNLHYVPGPHDFREARLLGLNNEGLIWWPFARECEQRRLARKFQREHLQRLRVGRMRGASQPFPVPRLRRPVDQEQVAQFKRTVNTVVGMFGRLKRHAEQTRPSSSVPLRDIWGPGGPYYAGIKVMVFSPSMFDSIMSTWHAGVKLREYLRELLWKKLTGDTQ